MSDTTIFSKDETGSRMFGVSVRAWIAITLVLTVCVNHVSVAVATVYSAVATNNFALVGSLTTIGEPLYSMSVAALGFYFGTQGVKSTTQLK